MRKLFMTLLVVIATITLTTKLSAQYSIPSFDVPVIADPTTFEEALVMSASFNTAPKSITYFIQKPGSRGEKDLKIKVTDTEIATTAWVTVEIYSLDNTIVYGPYTIVEGTTFSRILSTDYQWGVNTIAASSGSLMDVWFE